MLQPINVRWEQISGFIFQNYMLPPNTNNPSFALFSSFIPLCFYIVLIYKNAFAPSSYNNLQWVQFMFGDITHVSSFAIFHASHILVGLSQQISFLICNHFFHSCRQKDEAPHMLKSQWCQPGCSSLASCGS